MSATKRSLSIYLNSRWNGQRSAPGLFWWDLTVVGTLINGVLGLASLLLLAKGVDGFVWLAFHLMLIPYNLFLVLSVHRNTESNLIHRGGSIAWLACTLLV
ncbi:MAG TPA: hypothetical protein PLF79_17380 [Thauera sp.]|uniref:hypothetical protein n=1 Tax=Thauera sp. TaxID=1905334 RepID=UPI002BBD8D91|nr:hypothetical protein [Thauera sp.]HRP23407.1 hypothetical protein [Thauera sp.]HRP67848.1 hypothetical protein [Thauera sp.]